jgi:hypothetical protein
MSYSTPFAVFGGGPRPINDGYMPYTLNGAVNGPSWGQRNDAAYAQQLKEVEKFCQAIQDYITNVWNNWLTDVCAPKFSAVWSGTKTIIGYEITEMGIMADQAAPPIVQFTSESIEWEMHLRGIGVTYDTALSSSQPAFITDAEALSNVMASYQYTMKNGALQAISQKEKTIGKITEYFYRGQQVTLGQAMEKVNSIFGVINKGDSRFPGLMNEFKTKQEENRRPLDILLTTSNVLNAPFFLDYFKYHNTGNQIQSAPELAFRIGSWIKNAYEVQGMNVYRGRFKSAFKSDWMKGSWFLLKSAKVGQARIAITSGPDDSFSDINERDAVFNAINFDSAGDWVEPDMAKNVIAGTIAAPVRVLPGPAPGPPGGVPGGAGGLPIVAPAPSAFLFPTKRGLYDIYKNPNAAAIFKTGPDTALKAFNLTDAAQQVVAVTYLQNLEAIVGNGVFNSAASVALVGAPNNLNLTRIDDLLVAAISTNFNVATGIDSNVPQNLGGAQTIIETFDQAAVLSPGSDDYLRDYRDLILFVAFVLNGIYTKAYMDNYVTPQLVARSGGAAAIILASKISSFTPDERALGQDMQILKASLETNKLANANEIRSIFSRNKNLESALQDLSRISGVTRSHIEDHREMCTNPAIQGMIFDALSPDDLRRKGVLSTPTMGALPTKKDLLDDIDASVLNDTPRVYRYAILVMRPWQFGEGSMMAFVKGKGESVEVKYGNPTYGSGVNASTGVSLSALRIPIGFVVNEANIACFSNIHITSYNSESFGTKWISGDQLRVENGYYRASLGKFGNLVSIIIPFAAKIPTAFTLGGDYEIQQLEGAPLVPAPNLEDWQIYMRAILNHDGQKYISTNEYPIDGSQIINLILERGTFNVYRQDGIFSVKGVDAFGTQMSGNGCGNVLNGGYAHEAVPRYGGYFPFLPIS